MMGDPTSYTFNHKELVEALMKKQGLHEGIWQITFKFGLGAVNSGPSDNAIYPTAMIPVLEVGLKKADKENAISADASKVNPKPKKRKK